MKNVFTALCILAVIATSCTKSKEQKRLFAERHWHRSRTTTTTCYTLDTPQQQISQTTTTSELDTIFAITKDEDGGINFLGYSLMLRNTDDPAEYIYSNGHGTWTNSFMLVYEKSRNVISTRISFEGRQYDIQNARCYDKYDSRWTSTK